MPEDNIRMQIIVSPYIYKKLQIWASIHGRTPSAFAGHIVSARVEANLDLIQRIIDEIGEGEAIADDEQ